jgi:hypothetical protein
MQQTSEELADGCRNVNSYGHSSYVRDLSPVDTKTAFAHKEASTWDLCRTRNSMGRATRGEQTARPEGARGLNRAVKMSRLAQRLDAGVGITAGIRFARPLESCV